MDARRANSASDGRRRRRIVQDADELLAEFEQLAPDRRPAREPVATTAPADQSDHRILTKLISGRIWKLNGLLLVVVLAACGAVWAEFRHHHVLKIAGEAGTPRISSGLAGIFVLLTGQLALLIGWIRSESAVDFNGRYRWWKWLAAILVTVGVVWIANIQHTLPLLAQAIAEPVLGSISAARRTLVVVPVASIGILVLSRVIPDMGRNRFAQILFTTGLLIAAVRLLLAYGPTVEPLPAPLPDTVLLTAAAMLICSLVLHTRFVLYICNDPPHARLAQATGAQGEFGQAETIADPAADTALISMKVDEDERPKKSSPGHRKSAAKKTSAKKPEADKPASTRGSRRKSRRAA